MFACRAFYKTYTSTIAIKYSLRTSELKGLPEQSEEGLELFPKSGEGTTRLNVCRKVVAFPWT